MSEADGATGVTGGRQRPERPPFSAEPLDTSPLPLSSRQATAMNHLRSLFAGRIPEQRELLRALRNLDDDSLIVAVREVLPAIAQFPERWPWLTHAVDAELQFRIEERQHERRAEMLRQAAELSAQTAKLTCVGIFVAIVGIALAVVIGVAQIVVPLVLESHEQSRSGQNSTWLSTPAPRPTEAAPSGPQP